MISADYGQNPPVQTPRPRRLFLAITLPQTLREAIADLSQRLQTGARFTPLQASWVPASNFHMTLHFLGPVEEARVHDLQATLGTLETQSTPFSLDFQGLGYFPHPRAPKVLWLGIPKPPTALSRLVEDTADAIRTAGLDLKHDNFHPHITLARFRSLKGTAAFVNLAKNYAQAAPGTCAVDRIVLMESLFTEGAPEYRPVAEIPLGPPGN